MQARDLALLKLYAGGAQDLWDLRQLLALVGEASGLAADIEAEISELPIECATLWESLWPDGR